MELIESAVRLIKSENDVIRVPDFVLICVELISNVCIVIKTDSVLDSNSIDLVLSFVSSCRFILSCPVVSLWIKCVRDKNSFDKRVVEHLIYLLLGFTLLVF